MINKRVRIDAFPRLFLLGGSLLIFGCAGSVSLAGASPKAAGTDTPSVSPSHAPIGSQSKALPNTPTIRRTPTQTALPTPALSPTLQPVLPEFHYPALPAGAIARLGKGLVNDVAVSPAADSIAVATSIGVYVYRLGEDGRTLEETWFGPTATPLHSVAFSPDGKTLASGSEGSYND